MKYPHVHVCETPFVFTSVFLLCLHKEPQPQKVGGLLYYLKQYCSEIAALILSTFKRIKVNKKANLLLQKTKTLNHKWSLPYQ